MDVTDDGVGLVHDRVTAIEHPGEQVDVTTAVSWSPYADSVVEATEGLEHTRRTAMLVPTPHRYACTPTGAYRGSNDALVPVAHAPFQQLEGHLRSDTSSAGRPDR